MTRTDEFEDFDLADVYSQARTRALDPHARNFVVEFGLDKANIAFNLSHDIFKQRILEGKPAKPKGTPVRWINIWAPNKQHEYIDVLADHYKFSYRFRAILKSSPVEERQEEVKPPAHDGPDSAKTTVTASTNDLEKGLEDSARMEVLQDVEETTHYEIASRLVNFQSFDLGNEFMAIGFNYIFEMEDPAKPQRRLWTWLILCNDATVISLHEDLQIERADQKYMLAIRSHSLNILEQLSTQSRHSNKKSVSIVSVRFNPKSNDKHTDFGTEGSSNLFYYLFDNWSGTYMLVSKLQKRLEALSDQILKSYDITDHHRRKGPGYVQPKEIIQGLYTVGKELRVNKQLYDSYENIITRILRYRADANSPSSSEGSSSPSSARAKHRERILVHRTASERFERLGDRIKLIVLSLLNGSIAEKDALVSTYFSIVTQRDSAATAKLSRNGALLSKLGVLFLPVSLMTSYFSTQLDDLQGVYSSRTYWIAFGVIMALSLGVVFGMSWWLVGVSEWAEEKNRRVGRWGRRVVLRR